MYITNKFVFIHIPKTGGNSFQNQILKHTNEIKTVEGHQDGEDRFGIKGDFTKHKHQTLNTYLKVFNEKNINISNLEFVTIVRNPTNRLISFYFSPHRTIIEKKKFLKKSQFIHKDIEFDESNFIEFCNNLPTQSEYLGSEIPSSQLTILKFENYTNEVSSFLKRYNIDFEESKLNPSKSRNKQKVTSDKSLMIRLEKIIKQTKHKEDFIRFNY
jgi:hypothetical protein